MKPSVQDAITRQPMAWTKLPIPVWLKAQYLTLVSFLSNWCFFNYCHSYRYTGWPKKVSHHQFFLKSY